MGQTTVSLDEALAHTRTGDVWLFRGGGAADTAIRVATNAPVNHVGMAVVLDDLPPLMWHAELGLSLEDVWTGTHHRGVQLHTMHEAVRTWHDKYGQRAWLRQLDVVITPEMENAVLRTIARFDGTPFPTAPTLAAGWVKGRARSRSSLETLFCAEVVATTYANMGLLDTSARPENWYDPGRFWSGDSLELMGGAQLGGEISVRIPPLPGGGDAAGEQGARLRRAASRAWWQENAGRVQDVRIADPLRQAAGATRQAAGATRQVAGATRQIAGATRQASTAWLPGRARPGG
ncbi:MAG: hypothetical protein WCF36_00860 [Candidatus Nanopelagicales bacterium]